MKNKVRFGWSREETLSQLENFYEYSLDEDIPHKSWQEEKEFLKTIGYHDPTVHKVYLAEDHVQMLNKTDNECPICNKDRISCIDYYVLGINLEDFCIDKYTKKNNMAHWEDRDSWFNKDTPACLIGMDNGFCNSHIDDVYESFEYTCCTCYSVFEL